MNKKTMVEKFKELAQEGIFEIPLAKPLASGEKEFSVLNLDLGSLTAQDMIECEEQWAMQYGRTAQAASYSAAFHLIIAARALKIPVEDLIGGITLKESVMISNCVVGFLVA